MHEHTVALQQLQHEALPRGTTAGTRITSDQPPSGRTRLHPLDVLDERRARARGSRRDARECAAAPARRRRHSAGKRDLHRRADRQVGVQDQLQPARRVVDQLGRPGHLDPGELHLRQAARLRQPVEGEDQRGRLGATDTPG